MHWSPLLARYGGWGAVWGGGGGCGAVWAGAARVDGAAGIIGALKQLFNSTRRRRTRDVGVWGVGCGGWGRCEQGRRFSNTGRIGGVK